jgi:hypothetical protein
MNIKLFFDLYLAKKYKKYSNICIDFECNKYATYNYENNKKRFYCCNHKLENMIIISKKCITCKIKQPNFNYENEKQALYCNECKLENMINIKDKKCIKCNIKIPVFNYENEKQALYCGDCKDDKMIDIKNKKCIKCNIKQPFFNYENEKNALYCSDCKDNNMIDIKSKKCIKCNIKIPVFNYENEKKATHCGDCKEENMIDIKHKKCIECNIKRPHFNYENKKNAIYCGGCKGDNMIDIKNKKCIECNIKRPTFNYENEKKATHCGDCKEENMINIKDKKCIKCNLTLANKKYKGHCLRCFIRYFPNEPIVRNYKIKEKHMTDYIKEEFKGLDLKFDKTLLCGCSKRRPDIFIDLFNYTIVIECDENQHKSKQYEEEEREWDIYDDLAKRPIIFIRFNPDGYKDESNKKINSCFKICKTTGIQIIANKKEFTKRLKKLKETIQFHLENKPKENINIIKLFYDF